MTGLDLTAGDERVVCTVCQAGGSVEITRNPNTGAPQIAYLPEGWTWQRAPLRALCPDHEEH